MKIRNSVKAIIIKNGFILTIRCIDKFGVFYLLPGGGQKPGETMIDALKRECLEEIGVEIIVKDLKLIREYIGKNHEFKEEDKNVHQIEFMFLCTIKNNKKPKLGKTPDSFQINIEWLPLKDIEKYRLYPQSARKILKNLKKSKKIYLGDIN